MMQTDRGYMIEFITFARAIAACLITNAHYIGIYPTDIIANGGLLCDILFFAVSGYCLCNIKNEFSAKGFLSWYGKRIWRIYLPTVLCTLVYIAIGAYSPSEKSLIWWLVYPTRYHFIASIAILYIPYFFCMKIKMIQKNIPLVMAILGVAWILIYLFFYDRSYYHIDSVYEPMIRFLFFESMLLGAWFRTNDNRLRNSGKLIYLFAFVVMFVLYFASKMVFSKYQGLSQFQFVNQIAIFVLVFTLLRILSGYDYKMVQAPPTIKSIAHFLSSMTLEIYVVQYVIIDKVKETSLSFPMNWIVVTVGILIAAFVLHSIITLIQKGVTGISVKQKL